MNDKDLKDLIGKLEDAELLPYEATAYNYLMEPLYDNLPFAGGLEGDRLFSLCEEIIISAIERLGL